MIIHYIDAQYQHCSGGAVLFVDIAWKSELSSVGASCFFQFFVFLFLPETGITAQVAPPELIVFVFALYYKRYAPPELWLLLWKRYSYQCDDNNDRQELWLCMKTIFILTSKINIAPAEHAVCRDCVEGRVKLRRIVLFFLVLFFSETGIIVQVAPPELIILVFALYYKRYAPPELRLFSIIDSHKALKKRFPLQFVAGTFF